MQKIIPEKRRLTTPDRADHERHCREPLPYRVDMAPEQVERLANERDCTDSACSEARAVSGRTSLERAT